MPTEHEHEDEALTIYDEVAPFGAADFEHAALTFYEDVPCDHRETATRSASVVDDDGRPITTATLTVCVKCGRPVAGQVTGAPLPPSP